MKLEVVKSKSKTFRYTQPLFLQQESTEALRAQWRSHKLDSQQDGLVSHLLLAALGSGELGRHPLLHFPAVAHDSFQYRDGTGPQGPSLVFTSGDPALKVPLEREEGVGDAVVSIAFLEEHLLSLGLERQKTTGAYVDSLNIA